MARWANSLMDTFKGDEATYAERCVVVIDDGSINITYGHEDGDVVRYYGREREPGHFELACPPLGAKATLHKFSAGKRLEGCWQEEGFEGMWRITLKD